MPVITFTNSKGGVGKTTASLLLACELANRDLQTIIIDADKNYPLMQWEQQGGRCDNLTIRKNDGEDSILDDITRARDDADFVIIDIEGTASLTIAYSISQSDLAIIPSQRSALDASEAVKTINMVKRQEQVIGRVIKTALLLTRTSPAIRSKGLKRMQESISNNQIDVFKTELYEREAYKAIFDYHSTLQALTNSQVSGLEKARLNSADYAVETIAKLQGESS